MVMMWYDAVGMTKTEKLIYDRKWRLIHKVELKKYNKEYRIANKKELKRKKHKFYLEHKEEIDEKNHKYWLSHKKEHTERSRKYWIAHKEERRVQKLKYRHKHKEHYTKYQCDYQRKKRRAAGIKPKIARPLHTKNVRRQRSKFYLWLTGIKNNKFETYIQLTRKEFKRWIECKFLIGMTWANRKLWHIDHRNPLCIHDLTTEDGCLAAWNYTNLQPLWAKDNLRKGSTS